jgi:hypothetical protein
MPHPPPRGSEAGGGREPGAGPRRRSRRGEPRARWGRRMPHPPPRGSEAGGGRSPEPGHGGEADGANPAHGGAGGCPIRLRGVRKPAEGGARSRATAAKPTGRTPRTVGPADAPSASAGFGSRRRARPGAGPRRRSRRGEPRARWGRRMPHPPPRGSEAGGGRGPEPGHGGEADGANPAHGGAGGCPIRLRGVRKPAEGGARSRATAAKPTGRTPRSVWMRIGVPGETCLAPYSGTAFRYPGQIPGPRGEP